MCPVTFIGKATHVHSDSSVDQTAFLIYVNQPNKIQYIQPTTVANVVKQAIKIDGSVHGLHSNNESFQNNYQIFLGIK